MNTSARLARPQLQVVPRRESRPNTRAADDLRTARKRMRHLAPWNVRPLPKMHSAVGKPAELPTLEERKRAEHLALRVFAVQMWKAAGRSALD